MESRSLPQKEPQEEPGPAERGDEPPPETGADEIPPTEGAGDDDLPIDEREADRDA